jgi:hypothetical protein
MTQIRFAPGPKGAEQLKHFVLTQVKDKDLVLKRLVSISEVLHAAVNSGNKYAEQLLQEAKCDCKQCEKRKPESPSDKVVSSVKGVIVQICDGLVRVEIKNNSFSFPEALFDKVVKLSGISFMFQVKERKDKTRYMLFVPCKVSEKKTKMQKEIEAIIKKW